METHNTAVLVIAANVRRFYDRQQAFRIYHGSTNSTRQSQYDRDNIIDTSKLNNVLSVDEEKKTALVEPNVSMDSLVAATLPYCLVPPVVMEFPGITAGGGFSGTSGESSSFRYGFFDRTIQRIEMVLANGEKVTASSTDKPDLFWGAAASFGTLGVITLLEIQLIESKTYVELTYHKMSNMPEAIKKMGEITKDVSNDYLDGIVFSKDWIVVCSGRLTSGGDREIPVQRFTRAKDPWFYLHTKKITSKATGDHIVELVPLVDYLFRYDRGGFWVGRYAFKYFITPFNRISRRVLDKFMHTRVMYHALHQSGHSNQYIIQDVAVPYEAADEFVNWLQEHFGHYPLWLCPLRQCGKAADSPHGLFAKKLDPNSPGYLMNFGVWGPGPSNRREFVRANRRLEQKVQDLQGKKWLYAHAYYTEEEFWSIYDRKEYDALRTKYHATYLPSVYDKIKVDIAREEKAANESWVVWLLALFWSIWPLSGLYGVYKAWMGGDYLLPKGDLRKIEEMKED
jgi:delta24-sterol reductase